MNIQPFMYHIEFYRYFEICLSCLAYAFDQVRTSDIDVIGETREESLRLIAQVYEEMSVMGHLDNYRTISRKEVEAALRNLL